MSAPFDPFTAYDLGDPIWHETPPPRPSSLPGATREDPFARHAAPPAPPRPKARPAGPWDNLAVDPETPVKVSRVSSARQVANRNLAVGFLLGALLVGGLAGWFLALTDATAGLPPCATEDSSHCYWDADTRGNGLGHDVVNP